MSRIRTNLITNRMANGAPTVSNGLVISGVTTSTNVSVASSVTATTYYGSGANLTNITSTTINNNADNRIITGSGTANTLEGEANLTFDGSKLTVNRSSDGSIVQSYRTGNTSGGGTELRVTDGYSSTVPLYAFWYNNNTGIGNPAANTTSFIQNGSEKLRITSDGYLKIGGHSANRDVGGLSAQMVHLEGTSGAASISLINNQNSGGNSALYLGKSRGTSIGSNVILQNGDPMGSIVWCGSDGNDMISQGAVITAEVDGTPGSNDMPGRLVLKTTADGAATPTERVRINSSGQFVVGTNPTVSSGNIAHIEAPTSFNSGETIVNIEGNNATAAARLLLHNNNTGANAHNEILGVDAGGQSTSSIRFYNTDQSNNYGEIAFGTRNQSGVPPEDRMRINKDGQITKPYQASFAAMKSGNAYSLNGQVFPFDTTTHNIGSHFNTSNYRFTAPVAGRYLFCFYSILNSSGQGRYEILINGSANQNGTRVHMTPNTSNWDHVSTSWILNLAANDYIQMTSVTNTGWHGGHWQRFCGELLS